MKQDQVLLGVRAQKSFEGTGDSLCIPHVAPNQGIQVAQSSLPEWVQNKLCAILSSDTDPFFFVYSYT